MRIPFIAGNWKMFKTVQEAVVFVKELRSAVKDVGGVEIVVAPPFTALHAVAEAARNTSIGVAAQNLYWEREGAFTGEVSPAMVREAGAEYAIIGHSERRTLHGETDEVVAAKTTASLGAGLVPLICVGETAEDLQTHGASAVPVAQLNAVLDTIPKGSDFVVAYEPVWAIGSGQAATPEQAQQVASALRDAIAQKLGDEVAAATRILYGGSVKAENIAGFMRQPDVDGALVGGASLDVEGFSAIVRFQKHVGV